MTKGINPFEIQVHDEFIGDTKFIVSVYSGGRKVCVLNCNKIDNNTGIYHTIDGEQYMLSLGSTAVIKVKPDQKEDEKDQKEED